MHFHFTTISTIVSTTMKILLILFFGCFLSAASGAGGGGGGYGYIYGGSYGSSSDSEGGGGAKGLSSNWLSAHATFYGDESAASTMGGACGFGNLHSNGYGTDTAALSETLFKKGSSCGQCFSIKCVESPHCSSRSPVITITSTNLCPPNWAQDSNDGGWCNPPRKHFDLSKPAFMKLADWKAGIIPINYKRVPCRKQGGIRFMFQGNDYWLLVFVINVGGSGDVSSMSVKGSGTDWIPMSHNWGASYQAFGTLGGEALSFKVTTYTTRETMVFNNVAPSDWSTDLTYEADSNFH